MKVLSEKLGEDIELLYQPVSIIKVIKELLKGKSLIRSLLNLTLEKIELNGCILDLGSKTGKSSYYRFLRKGNIDKVVFTDKYPKDPQVVKLDVEEVFPFKDEEFDIVLAIFLFEYVFNYLSAFKEIYRVLKKGGGQFLMAVPFIYEYHPDPEDYFRFTHAALIKLGKISGFKTIKIYILSEGIFTILGEKMVNLLIPRRLKYLKSLVRTAIFTINMVADRFIKIIIPCDYFFKLVKNFPLGYLVVYEKGEI